MGENEWHDAFRRSVTDLYAEFKDALDKAIIAFGLVNAAKIRETLQRLSVTAVNLRSILNEQYRPNWLGAVIQAAEKGGREGSNLTQAVKTLASQYDRVRPLEFTKDDSPYDFDEMFVELRDAGRLPDLFDKVIDTLTQIVASGAVDSVTIVNALQEVVAVLRANRCGSYVAMRQSVKVAVYIKNCVLVGLKRFPVTGVLVEAFEKTVEELENEQKTLEESLVHEMKRACLSRIPQIEHVESLAVALSGTEGPRQISDDRTADTTTDAQ